MNKHTSAASDVILSFLQGDTHGVVECIINLSNEENKKKNRADL